LGLSREKTLITHAATESARFLGYHITTARTRPEARRGQTRLMIPPQVIEAKVERYSRGDQPIDRTELTHGSDFTIVETYGQEYRGIVQYYAYAANRYWLHRLHWVMETSLLKTLAAKKLSENAFNAHVGLRFAPHAPRRSSRRYQYKAQASWIGPK
jgi:Type II intron maturase